MEEPTACMMDGSRPGVHHFHVQLIVHINKRLLDTAKLGHRVHLLKSFVLLLMGVLSDLT